MSADLVGLAGLSAALGVPVRWLRDEVRAGRLPCLCAGGRLLFNLNSVKESLAKRAAVSREEVSNAS